MLLRTALPALVLPVALLLSLGLVALARPVLPGAPRVIQRGVTDLERALEIALGPRAGREGGTRPVAFVVDVTPNTRNAAVALAAAFQTIGRASPHLQGRYRIGALGGELSRELKHPAALALEVRRIVREDTVEVNTIEALRTTLRDYTVRGGRIVYLADWHFEDDSNLETFIARLVRRGQTFSVVGAEAAWGRPWTEAFHPRVKLYPGQRFASGVGRSPFEEMSPAAPWHGGDTAYPHVPWRAGRWSEWTTAFPLYVDELAEEEARRRHDAAAERRDADEPEDLAAREGATSEEPAVSYAYPLASSWGPYGLMRAAAVTGGRYVLFSFNPSGRKNVTYDYGRCNAFPPDLRSRDAILRDLKRARGLPRAMIEAWHLLGSKRRDVVGITPPLDENLRPVGMDYARCRTCCGTLWETQADHDRFVRVLRADLPALVEAERVLQRALDRAKTVDPTQARYRADAEYFRHLAAVLRFQANEALLAAEAVPSDAWEDAERFPGLQMRPWVIPVEGEERLREVRNVRPRDAESGTAILARTRAFVERYGGTPPGETVAKNAIHTARVILLTRAYDSAKKDRGSGTPSESDAGGRTTPDEHDRPRAQPAPGGAPSGGGGPATGG